MSLYTIQFPIRICIISSKHTRIEYLGGWACFGTSILVIAMLTALIGDIASSFGCTIGLKDAVTAISFVAIGTSVPGQSLQPQNARNQ